MVNMVSSQLIGCWFSSRYLCLKPVSWQLRPFTFMALIFPHEQCLQKNYYKAFTRHPLRVAYLKPTSRKLSLRTKHQSRSSLNKGKQDCGLHGRLQFQWSEFESCHLLWKRWNWKLRVGSSKKFPSLSLMGKKLMRGHYRINWDLSNDNCLETVNCYCGILDARILLPR